ncbi:unnamed protein product, partial [Rotaria sp. Silwood1]
VPRLKSFTLKSFVHTDFEFTYLKWLLNNLNHITKLQIHLYSNYTLKTDQLIWKSIIDANFIRQYCLPDQIINLKYFYFYICAKRQSSLNNISEIINSFKINSFFISHQWTNVQCPFIEWTYQDKEYLRILALLISIPVQLKYIFVQKFEWLLYVIECRFHHLTKNALNSIRYAEFGISSCNIGADSSTHIGKQLVPFLNTYMPYLQTLRLWRPDDFPWTSIRPNIESGKLYGNLMVQWRRTLRTPESINEHVIVFEQDLCQLVQQLKEFVYLDIYGNIDYDKVEPYHLIVKKRFPNSRIYIQISRFSLWI